MITFEMVKAGYEAGIIKLINARAVLGDGVACQIGDNWFYFGGQTAEEYNDVEKYKNDIPKDDILKSIYEVLEQFSTEDSFEDEYLYYECFLKENLTPNREYNKNISLWGRLGVQIDMTPEEFKVLQKNDKAAKDLLVELIKSDRCSLYGESYFPPEPNEEHISEELGFDLDYQPIQKEQPMVDALDVFIESEVPFRLKEVFDIDAPEKIVQELIREVKADTDKMFDYEHFDIFLKDKYEELCGVDREAIKKLQKQISFLRDEIDGLNMLNDSEDLISIKKKQVAILECQLNAEKVGVKLYLAPEKIIDAEHLDCFWYGGQIGAFEYKGYTVSIEVHGDVSATLLDGSHKEELLYYNDRDNSGAYKYGSVLEFIKDDDTLHRLIDNGQLVFSLNNWVEYLVLDAEGNQINDIAWDNVLDNNVLEAFDDPEWVKYVVNEIVERDKQKGLQDIIDSCEEVSKAGKAPSPGRNNTDKER